MRWTWTGLLWVRGSTGRARQRRERLQAVVVAPVRGTSLTGVQKWAMAEAWCAMRRMAEVVAAVVEEVEVLEDHVGLENDY